MIDPREKEAEFVWQIVGFLQTLTDLLWEHYREEFDDYKRENPRSDEPWTE
jgi:hypothetical protein